MQIKQLASTNKYQIQRLEPSIVANDLNKLKHTQSVIMQVQKKQIVMPRIIQRVIDYVGHQHFAIILMSLAQLTYPTSFLYSNQHNLSFIQTSLARGISALFILYAIIRFYNISLDFKSVKDTNILNLRNFIMMIYSFVFTTAQFYLEQPILLTINSCGPIFIFVIDYFLNGVKVNKKQFIGILLAIFGVLLTVYGRVLTNLLFSSEQYSFQSTFQNYYTKNSTVKVIAGLLLLTTVVMWGYGQVITKKLTTLNFIHVNFHLGICFTLYSAILYPFFVKNPVELSTMVGAIFFCGIPSTISSIFFIGAITISKHTGVLTLFLFLSVIVGYFVSIFRYNEDLNALCLFGTIFLLIGLFKTVLNKQVNLQK